MLQQFDFRQWAFPFEQFRKTASYLDFYAAVGDLGRVGFLSHLRSLRATMSQKSSVPQPVSFVSQVMKRDSHHMAKAAADCAKCRALAEIEAAAERATMAGVSVLDVVALLAAVTDR
jgi:hypothetical protein